MWAAGEMGHSSTTTLRQEERGRKFFLGMAEPRGQHIGWAEPTVFDGVELGSTHLDYADVTSRYLGQNQEVLRTTPLSMLAQVVGSCAVGELCFSIRQVPRYELRPICWYLDSENTAVF